MAFLLVPGAVTFFERALHPFMLQEWRKIPLLKEAEQKASKFNNVATSIVTRR